MISMGRVPYRYDDEEEEEAAGKEKGGQDSDFMVKKMLETRSIVLSGDIDKVSAEKFVKQLILLEATGKEAVKVFIDSPGGDVDAGYAIFDMIRFVECPIYTIGMGLVASAGALILLAAPKERRIALPNSHYLIHQPLSGMRGVATDIEIHARELEKIKAKINALIAAETGKKLAQVEKDTDRDYWMNADEALSYGLVSKIVTKRSEL